MSDVTLYGPTGDTMQLTQQELQQNWMALYNQGYTQQPKDQATYQGQVTGVNQNYNAQTGLWAPGTEPAWATAQDQAKDEHLRQLGYNTDGHGNAVGGSLGGSPGQVIPGTPGGAPGAAPAPAGGGPAAGPAGPTGTAAQNASAYLQGVLDEYGLGSLGGWAYDLLVQGYDSNYVLQQLRTRPEFNDRFPAIAARKAAGLPPLSPADYVSLEKSYDGYMQSSGLAGMFDRKSLYTKWITGDVSPVEAKARGDAAYQAALGEPLETRNELSRMFGVGAGAAAAAYFLDPAQALPKLQEQLRAGEIGGAAVRSTYSLLTADEANHLAQLGISDAQAQNGFGDLANKRQLFQALPGGVGPTFDQDQQIAAEFEGNAQIQQQLQQVAEQRRAEFAGAGGGFRLAQQANGEVGLSGLGATST